MKGFEAFVCLLGLRFVASLAVQAVHKVAKPSPIEKVVELIQDLARDVEKDGADEQAAYDKYACWVEDTLHRKAADISAAKELIPQLDDSIKKGMAFIASASADIEQLKKDIAQNKNALREAQEVRDNEHKEYEGERTESEQCIGALEAAIKVLTGAGAKKQGGFLQQLREAQLMSVTMGVRKVLLHPRTASVISNENLEVVKRFVENPSLFAKQGVSAAQTGQNPFGDYAPQSTQIQGILKGMYDTFTSDLEKANAEEGDQEKNFQDLHGTKMQELATLEETLAKQEADKAVKTKQVAEDKTLREDTTEQLKADEAFFEETTEAAETKATQWSNRTRLRTEELAGMEGAIQILQGGSAVFEEAHNSSFLQVKSVQHRSSSSKVYGEVRKIASKYKSAALTKVLSVLKLGGHFDSLITEIDKMIKLCREEEQEDIEHRDRCENAENANANNMEDIHMHEERTKGEKEHLENEGAAKAEQKEEVEKQMEETKKEMEELLDLRNKDHAEFVRALKMDTEAIGLIDMAIVKLSKYYKENNIPLSLAQQPAEYSEDPDKAPETTFSDDNSHSAQSGGIVAILEMIKEDLQKEIKEGKADDAKAQAEYEKQSGSLEDALAAQEATKVSLEKDIQGLEEGIAAKDKSLHQSEEKQKSEEEEKQALQTDCKWVKTHFEARRKQRKAEIAGLVEAKNFLAGVDAGEPVLG